MRVGDIVVHKEMSIKMTITEVNDTKNTIKCCWFDEAYYIKMFNINELMTIDEYKLLLIQNHRDVNIKKIVKN